MGTKPEGSESSGSEVQKGRWSLLWALIAALVLLSISVALLMNAADESLPDVPGLDHGVVQVGVVILALAFSAYAVDRERVLRRLQDDLLHSRIEWERTLVHLETMRDVAHRDPLTGLHNRRAFDDDLATELERARRHARAVTVALVDLDHFKQVNDTRGHQAGDDVLKTISRVIAEALRRSDRCYRLGGDEFAVLLPETPLRRSLEVADRIRLLVEARGLGVTLSIGVAAFPETGLGSEELLERADDALYAVKAAGGNQVLAADSLLPD